jgi:UDP-N-acetylmuramoylalanine--D-glutamate ligase
VLVVGFAVTGQAMTRALMAHDLEVVVVDDHPSSVSRRAAESVAVELLMAPSVDELASIIGSVDAVLPSPGVPDRHAVFAMAGDAGLPVLSEFDLAARWDTDEGWLNASGLRALAVGNTEVPLVEAIVRDDLDLFVVEASSFRLGHTRHFEPAVATWLNFAEDHLDVHDSLDRYLDAKARIWADLGPDRGVAVANADDPTVVDRINPAARTITYGIDRPADYHLEGASLVTGSGELLVERDELWRDLPHDLGNALAASATALEGGGSVDGVRQVLREFRGLPHRVSLVGEWNDVAWYDDSKATAPHATLAALRGFESVVLIAGGHNKGLDLSALAAGSAHVRAVVAIGAAAPGVAVLAAADLALPGVAVLLSPGCASFDAYETYGERGDHFVATVLELIARGRS